MAGPREALLHALVRKNYGCTHFIIGRDHAGPSCKKINGDNFFEPYDAQNLLIKYSNDIGIIPILSKEIVYTLPYGETNENTGEYLPIDKVDKTTTKILNISGTQLRSMLKTNTDIPLWYSYKDVVDELKNNNKEGICLYFVGLSASGKSTLANFIISKLKEITNRKITLLDGDIVRLNLSKGLGFSKEDRSLNVRRIGYVASEIIKHGGICVVANIAPFDDDRKYNRELISNYGKYIQIYVNTDIETCEKRDVKGLYLLAKQGKIKEFTGISSPFENPYDSEININGENDLQKNIDEIYEYLINENIL
jgi:sulfate adenylyltransferase